MDNRAIQVKFTATSSFPSRAVVCSVVYTLLAVDTLFEWPTTEAGGDIIGPLGYIDETNLMHPRSAQVSEDLALLSHHALGLSVFSSPNHGKGGLLDIGIFL